LIPSDRKLQATQLVEQAERLARLARQLRREARELDPTVAIPQRQKRRRRPQDGRSPEAQQQQEQPQQVSDRPSPARRRFVPSAERAAAEPADASRDPGKSEISEGARLMITQMANLGGSREEILAMMRDELGIQNAEAALESLQLWNTDASSADRTSARR
jgi:hypothetical protein